MDVIDIAGVRMPFDPGLIVARVAREMRAGTYENHEAKALGVLVRPGDRVLDLGSGFGLTSTIAARVATGGRVMTFDGNPRVQAHLERVHRENGVTVERHNALVMADPAVREVDFYVRPQVWASSLISKPDKPEQRVSVPVRALRDVMADLQPTVLSCDIEGAECALVPAMDLSGIEVAVIELHPKVTGPEAAAGVEDALRHAGLIRQNHLCSRRVVAWARPPRARTVGQAMRDWLRRS